MSDYPKLMVHPQAVRGHAVPVPGTDPNSGKPYVDYQGVADRFPPVEVHSSDQEGAHRAKGYVPMGEKSEAYAFHEYPMQLSHPGYAPEQVGDHATPARFPPVIVNSAAQAEEYIAKGYVLPGKSDPDAAERATASPYDPNRGAPEEFPKMVDGAVVDPYAKAGVVKYPMWVGSAIVNNEAEEKIARQALGIPDEKPHDAPAPADVTIAALMANVKALTEQVAKLTAKSAIPDDQLLPIEGTIRTTAGTVTAPLTNLSPIEQPEDERHRLLRVAKDRGVKVHHKWGIPKLREALGMIDPPEDD